MSSSSFEPGEKAFECFSAICKSRKSVRFFGTKPVTQEQVLALLTIAQHSPSVANTQPWHFHVVFNRDIRRDLMDASCYGNFIEGAGVFVVVSCDRNAKKQMEDILWNPRELEYSCVVAMTHILLGASAMGMGACFISLHHESAHAKLNMPEGHAVIGGIMLGYAQKYDDPQALIPHPTKPLKELYTLYT